MKTADARTAQEACDRVASAIESNASDLPFVLIYLIEPEKRRARLAANCGIARASKAAPEAVTLEAGCVWPLEIVLWEHRPALVSNPAAVSGDLPMVRGQYQCCKRASSQSCRLPRPAAGPRWWWG